MWTLVVSRDVCRGPSNSFFPISVGVTVTVGILLSSFLSYHKSLPQVYAIFQSVNFSQWQVP